MTLLLGSLATLEKGSGCFGSVLPRTIKTPSASSFVKMSLVATSLENSSRLIVGNRIWNRASPSPFLRFPGDS